MDPLLILILGIAALGIAKLLSKSNRSRYEDGYFYPTKDGLWLMTTGMKQMVNQTFVKAHELEGELGRLTTKNAELEVANKELVKQVQELNTKLEQLESSKHEEIAKVIEAGRIELEALANEKASLEATIEDLKTKVATLESKIAEPAPVVAEHKQIGVEPSSKVTARDEILSALERGGLTFKELVVKTERSKSTVSEALQKLVREGIAGRDPNTEQYYAVHHL